MPFQGKATYRTVMDAAGNGIITITPDRLPWRITQISMEHEHAAAGSVCTLRLNGRFVSFLIATGDAAGGDPPLDIYPGDRLTIEWELCAPGEQATALVLYDALSWQADAVNP